MTVKFYVPILLEVEVEQYINAAEIEKVKSVVKDELGYCLSEFDFIQDAIAERVSSDLVAIRMKSDECSI